MECFIVEAEDVADGELYLRGDEGHHALRSLRLRVGEELLATDLRGTSYRCTLVEALDKGTVARCAIVEIQPELGEAKRDVLLIQGMISQPARWEFLLEKATELGVRTIQPVLTERTERSNFKLDRSERILRAAVKQTRRSSIPELRLAESKSGKPGAGELSSLSAALSEAVHQGRRMVILHEAASLESSLWQIVASLGEDPVAILVGPEGGFTEEEVRLAQEAGARVASLGNRRLRAETAAIAALAIVVGHQGR